jgi:MFS family permease
LLREPAALAGFAAALTVFGSFVALYAVLSDHLSGRLGYTGGQLLGVQAIGALGLAVAPVVNRLAGARGPRFLAVAGFLTALCGLLLAQYTAVPAILVAGTVVFVGGIGLVVPSLVGLLHQVVPYARGAAVSVNTTVLFVGASLGQVLAAGASYHRTLGVLSAAVLLAAGAVATTARLTPTA